MTEDVNQIIKIISDIQYEIGTMMGDDYFDSPTLILNTTRDYQEIEFLGECIWDSENEPRDYIDAVDDYEPLDYFLIKQINKRIKQLSKINLNCYKGEIKC